jgi:hypothetical protein
MLRFRLLADSAIDVYHPAGHGDSLRIDPGKTVEVAGEVVTSRPKPKGDEPEPAPLPDDAYIVVNNGEEKAWPHTLWELVEDKPASKTAAKPESKTEPAT